MKALLIVDVQNDFMPGGALAVPHSEVIIPIINQLQRQFDLIIATQDWHPRNHQSFASNHSGKKPFETIMLHGIEQVLWPDHCIQGSEGAEFYSKLESDRVETIFRKGTDPEIDSYSGFYDNKHRKSTGLSGYLKEKKVNEIYICGLCADICVYHTIKDALAEGFSCCLIEDATYPLNPLVFQNLKSELLDKGVRILTSEQLFSPL
ncbi:bifunctional nicotinamidase/pyrazinamidase [Legionella jordanis]|uniref:nicotinamidase n=1 Tax=Legionella jordanis TaxID=456 RepID=A0A0W0VB07_9GAMM|nr:bifunctional nicotinamidase/pyrazinamidase [Legionella jordanis]KTD17303.1 bifunctional pyrazinamidase/nicotinamidase [Legionella jordanis]RMW99454.1 bifunctional nicotinamidase/pyrazinamidase [Legionella jordanis]RMX15303.1 bifunctional nicotinamidase/pyrazinamidase [Legionella jordanis]VEH12498.1 bifunctional pyrazinamidase/nicotinamidase [Legionella jordanis]HAT8715224.1 bifunctional nicotinamidase/pyrazinamidase [Legionella jordanis]